MRNSFSTVPPNLNYLENDELETMLLQAFGNNTETNTPYQNIVSPWEGLLSQLVNSAIRTVVHNTGLEDLEDVAVHLTEEQFESIPTVEITKEETCTVCLENIEKSGKQLKCKHTFHNDCIEEWLTKRSKRCPVCRAEAMQETE